MKTIVGNVMPEETRMAILEDGRLRDFAVERDDDMHIVNHIYKGTIQNILPSLQVPSSISAAVKMLLSIWGICFLERRRKKKSSRCICLSASRS